MENWLPSDDRVRGYGIESDGRMYRLVYDVSLQQLFRVYEDHSRSPDQPESDLAQHTGKTIG